SQVLLPYPFDRCCVLHAPTIIKNSNSYKTNLLNLFFRGSLVVTVARPHARLASRLLARLCRTGLVTRRVSTKGFTFLR
ncbi:MAG: hypothetical protein ABSH35_25665, partial [Isosphaeraceae bacterium]